MDQQTEVSNHLPMNLAVPSSGAVKLNRTCQACRIRKIKCVYDDVAPQCQRCSKLSISCVFEPPAIRKRRERNETRIRELERKIEGLQAVVSRGHSAASSSPSESTQGTDHDHNLQQNHDESPVDSISQGLLTTAEAGELYRVFHDQYAPLYPLVSPPPPQVWRHVRAEQPALFRAALAAACGSMKPELWQTVFKDTERYLVHEVMILGNRSLSLIQAVLIMATWNHPPKEFQKLTFNHMINMAATMVIDLRSSNDPQYGIPSSTDSLSTVSDSLIELCRTFIATYFLCSSVAISFRRPSVLRYGSWVADCLRVMDHVPNPSLNNQRLVAWARLHRMAEESLTVAGLEEDPHIDASDMRTKFIIERCIEQITAWKQSVPDGLINGAIDIHHHMLLLVLNEPALYGSHKLDDFRPPYAIRSMSNERPQTFHESTHIRAQCLHLAHGLLNAFVSYDDDDIGRLPVIILVRMMHAVVVLIKLATPADALSQGPSSNVEIFDRLVQKLGRASRMGSLHLPRLFHFVLLKLFHWYRNNYLEQRSGDQGTIEPLMGINDEHHERETRYPDVGTSTQALQDVPTCFQQDQFPPSTTQTSWDKLSDTFLSSDVLTEEAAMAFMDQMFGNGPLNFVAPSVWS